MIGATSLQFHGEREPNVNRGFAPNSLLKGIRRRWGGGFHEDADPSQDSREQSFSFSPAACTLLSSRELRAGGAGCIDTGFVSKVSDGAEESCFVGVVLMSAIPTGLRWRRFVCPLRDLVYRPLKSHRASLRQLFSPIHSANQNLISRASCRRHPAQSHLVRLIPQTSTQPG